jgi:hypothetical protein
MVFSTPDAIPMATRCGALDAVALADFSTAKTKTNAIAPQCVGGMVRRGREPHRSCRGSVGDSQGAPFGTSTLAMQIRRENITLSP